MPFTIDDFPIEVNRPKIDVVLPEGTHVLELVVEDSAGLKSAPDRVVITVKREAFPEPKVLSITPALACGARRSRPLSMARTCSTCARFAL
jgi:hypothetical protein